MKLLITIDTECDNAWTKTAQLSTPNARFIPRFQELSERFSYKPTYLTSHEMAKDEFFVEFAHDLLRRYTAEIGAHPHAWNSPPRYNLISDNMRLHPRAVKLIDFS